MYFTKSRSKQLDRDARNGEIPRTGFLSKAVTWRQLLYSAWLEKPQPLVSYQVHIDKAQLILALTVVKLEIGRICTGLISVNAYHHKPLYMVRWTSPQSVSGYS